MKKSYVQVHISGLHLRTLHHRFFLFFCLGGGPCLTYQQDLKRKAVEILEEKWRHSMNFLKNETREKTFKYTPLVLDTEASDVVKIKCKPHKKSRSKKLKTYIPTDRRNLTPEHLLLASNL